MACHARVGGHVRRSRGGTLVEHAGEALRLSCEEGDQCHIQPCEQVPAAASRRSDAREDRYVADWSGAQRSKDCAQVVVQCHVQFICVWTSATDRCRVLGGGEDQSLGGSADGLRCGSPDGSGEAAYQRDSGLCFR